MVAKKTIKEEVAEGSTRSGNQYGRLAHRSQADNGPNDQDDQRHV